MMATSAGVGTLQGVDVLAPPNPTSARGCYHPVQLRQVDAVTGLPGPGAPAIYVRCGSRHEGKCPACAERFRRDAVTLIERGVPSSRKPGHHLLFITLTAPGADFFGSAHHRRTGQWTGVCPCGTAHSVKDDILGAPIDPDAFNYDRAARWNAALPELWRRFLIALERELPSQRIEYVRVVEMQRRGLFHVHAIVRVEPSERERVDRDEVRGAVGRAAGTPVVSGMVFGVQTDVKFAMQRPPRRKQGEAESAYKARVKRARTRNTFARYLAKYATKSISQRNQQGEELQQHFARLSAAAEPLAQAWFDARMADRIEREQAGAVLGDRRMARKVLESRARHMTLSFGFGGQFLTKSRNFSTTFRALREETRLVASSAVESDSSIRPAWVVEGFGVLPAHEDAIHQYWVTHLQPLGYDPPVFCPF